LLLGGIVLVGCQSSQNVVLNQRYKDADFSGRTVAHLPIPLDAIVTQDTAQVRADFANDKRPPEVVVQDSLYRKMIFQTSRSLLSGRLVFTDWPSDLFRSQRDSSRFAAIKLAVPVSRGDSEYTFYVPRKEFLPDTGIDVGIAINSVSIDTDVVAQGGSYSPGPGISTPGGWMPTAGTYSPGGRATLRSASIQFIMWDYRLGQPVTYGVAHADPAPEYSGSSTSTMFRVIAQRVFENSPFRWKRIVR
jgi:hypothetical protein